QVPYIDQAVFFRTYFALAEDFDVPHGNRRLRLLAGDPPGHRFVKVAQERLERTDVGPLKETHGRGLDGGPRVRRFPKPLPHAPACVLIEALQRVGGGDAVVHHPSERDQTREGAVSGQLVEQIRQYRLQIRQVVQARPQYLLDRRLLPCDVWYRRTRD